MYAWNGGYWGPQIGFYGGVNYGFGYVGDGYEGGRWEGDHFFYNRSVNNVNVTVIHNVYTKTVVNNYNSTTRASFNGPGGVNRRPTAQEETYAHEQHTPATATQVQHREEAAKDRSQYASVNHGKPAVAATAKPGEFKGAGVVPAKAAAPYKGATGKGAASKGAANTRGEKPTGGTAAKSTKTPARSATSGGTPSIQTLAQPLSARARALRQSRQHARTRRARRANRRRLLHIRRRQKRKPKNRKRKRQNPRPKPKAGERKYSAKNREHAQDYNARVCA